MREIWFKENRQKFVIKAVVAARQTGFACQLQKPIQQQQATGANKRQWRGECEIIVLFCADSNINIEIWQE